jgi:hypothetical protein
MWERLDNKEGYLAQHSHSTLGDSNKGTDFTPGNIQPFIVVQPAIPYKGSSQTALIRVSLG